MMWLAESRVLVCDEATSALDNVTQATHSPALALVLRLAPGVTRTWFGLLGVTGETQLTDRPLLEALTDGASLERLLDVGTPRAGRDVRGVLEVLHSRQLLAWQRSMPMANHGRRSPRSEAMCRCRCLVGWGMTGVCRVSR